MPPCIVGSAWWRSIHEVWPICSPILPIGVEGWFMITFDWTKSTRELGGVPCAGEAGKGGDTLVEGTWAPDGSGCWESWDVNEAGRLVRGDAQLHFRLNHCSIDDCLPVPVCVDVAMRVRTSCHPSRLCTSMLLVPSSIYRTTLCPEWIISVTANAEPFLDCWILLANDSFAHSRSLVSFPPCVSSHGFSMRPPSSASKPRSI